MRSCLARRGLSGPRRLLIVAVLGMVALCAAGVAAALPQQAGSVDLIAGAQGEWDGAGEAQGGSDAGAALVGLGDVFGRGRAAVAIGAPEANPSGRLAAGSVYVVPGPSGPRSAPVDLTALSGRGIRIDGASAGDQFGFSLASVPLPGGDPGLLVGAPQAGGGKVVAGGRAFLIDLRRVRGSLDLARTPYPRAVVAVLGGIIGCSEVGYSVAVSGGWLMTGAPGYAPGGCPAGQSEPTTVSGPGAAYAIRLAGLKGSVTLGTGSGASAGTGAGRVAMYLGLTAGDRTGESVASAAAERPGRFLLGAPYASPSGRAGAGAAWLVPEPQPGATVELKAPPAGTVLFAGARANDVLGMSVGVVAGFVRGDGARADAVLGAPQATPTGRYEAGETYVVPLGADAGVDLGTPPAGSVTLIGAGLGDESGATVASLGPVTGTGASALAIGAPFANSQTGLDRENNGAAYVLAGGAYGPGTVDLAHLRGGTGYSIFGARNGDEAGSALAGVANLAGDGRPGLLVGAPFGESRFGSTPTEGGDAYAIDGYGAPRLAYTARSVTLRRGRPVVLAPRVTRTGAAAFSVSPGLPRGLSLNRRTGVITGRPRTPSGPRFYTVTLDDAAGETSVALELAVVR